MENSSFIGVVSAKNARHEKPPKILLNIRNPRLNPSTVTARLNIPSSKIWAPTPKRMDIKINVIRPKIKGMDMNFK